VNLPPDRGPTPNAELTDDMAVFGVRDFTPPDWMVEEDPAGECGVLGENWEAVQVFLACHTQWRRNRDDVPVGLDYAGVDVVLARCRVAEPDDAFARVRVMEDAAVLAFAEVARGQAKA
jgi:hypothetical protein